VGHKGFGKRNEIGKERKGQEKNRETRRELRKEVRGRSWSAEEKRMRK